MWSLACTTSVIHRSEREGRVSPMPPELMSLASVLPFSALDTTVSSSCVVSNSILQERTRSRARPVFRLKYLLIAGRWTRSVLAGSSTNVGCFSGEHVGGVDHNVNHVCCSMMRLNQMLKVHWLKREPNYSHMRNLNFLASTHVSLQAVKDITVPAGWRRCHRLPDEYERSRNSWVTASDAPHPTWDRRDSIVPLERGALVGERLVRAWCCRHPNGGDYGGHRRKYQRSSVKRSRSSYVSNVSPISCIYSSVKGKQSEKLSCQNRPLCFSSTCEDIAKAAPAREGKHPISVTHRDHKSGEQLPDGARHLNGHFSHIFAEKARHHLPICQWTHEESGLGRNLRRHRSPRCVAETSEKRKGDRHDCRLAEEDAWVIPGAQEGKQECRRRCRTFAYSDGAIRSRRKTRLHSRKEGGTRGEARMRVMTRTAARKRRQSAWSGVGTRASVAFLMLAGAINTNAGHSQPAWQVRRSTAMFV